MEERDPGYRWIAAHPVWTAAITLVLVLGFAGQLVAVVLVGSGAFDPRPAATSSSTP